MMTDDDDDDAMIIIIIDYLDYYYYYYYYYYYGIIIVIGLTYHGNMHNRKQILFSHASRGIFQLYLCPPNHGRFMNGLVPRLRKTLNKSRFELGDTLINI